MVPLSVLDLAPIVEGETAADALRKSLDLARHAERLGYTRYWVAEHHNMKGIASAATSVVIGHLAAGTATIRFGAGGILLPNHAPLVIAEQFGTLEALHPGRIDLALGRAPGTDAHTARALRRDGSNPDQFPQDVLKLQAPIDDIETYWTPYERAHVESMLRYSFAGAPETVRRGLENFVAMTGVDELMVVSHIFDHAARLRSYELLAEIHRGR